MNYNQNMLVKQSTEFSGWDPDSIFGGSKLNSEAPSMSELPRKDRILNRPVGTIKDQNDNIKNFTTENKLNYNLLSDKVEKPINENVGYKEIRKKNIINDTNNSNRMNINSKITPNIIAPSKKAAPKITSLKPNQDEIVRDSLESIDIIKSNITKAPESPVNKKDRSLNKFNSSPQKSPQKSPPKNFKSLKTLSIDTNPSSPKTSTSPSKKSLKNLSLHASPSPNTESDSKISSSASKKSLKLENSPSSKLNLKCLDIQQLDYSKLNNKGTMDNYQDPTSSSSNDPNTQNIESPSEKSIEKSIREKFLELKNTKIIETKAAQSPPKIVQKGGKLSKFLNVNQISEPVPALNEPPTKVKNIHGKNNRFFEESDLIFDSLDLKPRQHSNSRRYNISKSPSSAFDKKSNDSAVDDAAIMIQKAYRGHSGRKEYSRILLQKEREKLKSRQLLQKSKMEKYHQQNNKDKDKVNSSSNSMVFNSSSSSLSSGQIPQKLGSNSIDQNQKNDVKSKSNLNSNFTPPNIIDMKRNDNNKFLKPQPPDVPPRKTIDSSVTSLGSGGTAPKRTPIVTESTESYTLDLLKQNKYNDYEIQQLVAQKIVNSSSTSSAKHEPSKQSSTRREEEDDDDVVRYGNIPTFKATPLKAKAIPLTTPNIFTSNDKQDFIQNSSNLFHQRNNKSQFQRIDKDIDEISNMITRASYDNEPYEDKDTIDTARTSVNFDAYDDELIVDYEEIEQYEDEDEDDDDEEYTDEKIYDSLEFPKKMKITTSEVMRPQIRTGGLSRPEENPTAGGSSNQSSPARSGAPSVKDLINAIDSPPDKIASDSYTNNRIKNENNSSNSKPNSFLFKLNTPEPVEMRNLTSREKLIRERNKNYMNNQQQQQQQQQQTSSALYPIVEAFDESKSLTRPLLLIDQTHQAAYRDSSSSNNNNNNNNNINRSKLQIDSNQQDHNMNHYHTNEPMSDEDTINSRHPVKTNKPNLKINNLPVKNKSNVQAKSPRNRNPSLQPEPGYSVKNYPENTHQSKPSNGVPLLPSQKNSKVSKQEKQKLALLKQEEEERRLMMELKEIEDRQLAKLHQVKEGIKKQEEIERLAAEEEAKTKKKSKKKVNDDKAKLAFGPGAKDYRDRDPSNPRSNKPSKDVNAAEQGNKKKSDLKNNLELASARGHKDAQSEVQSVSEVSSKKKSNSVMSFLPNENDQAVPSLYVGNNNSNNYNNSDNAKLVGPSGAGYLNKFHSKHNPVKNRNMKNGYSSNEDDISDLTSMAPSGIASEGNRNNFKQNKKSLRNVNSISNKGQGYPDSMMMSGGDEMLSLPAIVANASNSRVPSAPYRGREGQPNSSSISSSNNNQERNYSAPSRMKTIRPFPPPRGGGGNKDSDYEEEPGGNPIYFPDVSVKVSHDYEAKAPNKNMHRSSNKN